MMELLKSRGAATATTAALSNTAQGSRPQHRVPDLSDDPTAAAAVPLKCNRKPAEDVSDITNHFPYRRYELYRQRLAELERVERLQCLTQGKVIPKLDSITDEILKQEFSTLYGRRLDEDDPLFVKLFQTYMEGRREELKSWEFQEQNPLHSYADGVIIKPDIHSEFTAAEIELFRAVSAGPVATGKEFFQLPRPQLTPDDIRRLKRKSVNLALFDPELSPHPGNRVVPSQSGSGFDRGISEKLSCNIHEIVSGHPAGIVASQFLVEYKNRYNHMPDIAGLGYRNLPEFLVDIKHAAFTQGGGPNNDCVMYPTYLENLICSPSELLWRIHHKLLVLCQFFGGVAKAGDLVDYLEELYHVQIPFRSWGFGTADEFVVYLVENVKWKSDFYGVESSALVENEPEAEGHYVIRMSERRRRLLENRKINRLVEPVRRHSPSLLQPYYLTQSVEIVRESEIVRENTEDDFVVVHWASPVNFEIVRAAVWDSLDSYVRKWSEFYQDLIRSDDSNEENPVRADPAVFDTGYPLVIFKEDTKDYVRAEYLKPGGKPRLHLVHLLDDGGKVTVAEKNMFYLHKSVMADLRAQAIPVGFHGVRHESNWSEDVLNYAYDLIRPRDLHSRFRVKFIAFDAADRNWLVKMADVQQRDLELGQAISQRRRDGVSSGSPRRHHHLEWNWSGDNHLNRFSKAKPVLIQQHSNNSSCRQFVPKCRNGSDEQNWRCSSGGSPQERPLTRVKDLGANEADLASNWRSSGPEIRTDPQMKKDSFVFVPARMSRCMLMSSSNNSHQYHHHHNYHGRTRQPVMITYGGGGGVANNNCRGNRLFGKP